MKPQYRKSTQLTAGLLCALALIILPACQKAKMTSVPRLAETPAPAATDPTVTPTTQTPPTVQPPTIQPPTTGPRPLPGTPGPVHHEPEVTESDVTRPVMVYTPAPRNPIVVQPPVKFERDIEVEWFETGRSSYDVLSSCHAGPCEEEQQADPLTQPDAAPTGKVDVLFVVDTSASLIAEYGKIFSNISSYVSKLDPNTDFRFAVILGHGPEAQIDGRNYFGRFWSAPVKGGGRDAAVIKVGKLGTGAEREQKINAVANHLMFKILGGIDPTTGKERTRIPPDRTHAEGEALLSNLNEFLVNQFDQSADFPRKGEAALSVIFIADENDICFDYRGTKFTPNFKAKPGIEKDGVVRDAPEHNSFYSNSICKAQGQHVDYNLLASNFRQRYPDVEASMPLIVSGILYRTDDEVPRNGDTFAKDNEVGHGYLELIQLLNGEAVNLGSSDSAQRMAVLGDFTSVEIQFTKTFPLTSEGEWIDISNLGALRIEIHGKDGSVEELPEEFYSLVPLRNDSTRGQIRLKQKAFGSRILHGDTVVPYYKMGTRG